MGIYEKLLTLQAKLKVPKGQYSDFGGYYYRSCEDITEAAKPLLLEVKAVLLLTDEIVVIGNRTYVKAVAKLIDTESDGVVEVDGYAREDESQKGKDVAQITGSCSSYARKYALNGLFALDDAKDADALPPVQQPAEKPAGKVTSHQLAQLQALAKQKGVAVDSIVAGYKLNSLQDMDTKQWAQTMNSLRKRADAQ
ncbi:MAG: ERF family protein [Phascolarctobacterium sp.]|uniref:ERF family protein n=1 Tax=Phascolarctobacterium sp. TaxID=2049039 RepID=UPI003A0FD08E